MLVGSSTTGSALNNSGCKFTRSLAGGILWATAVFGWMLLANLPPSYAWQTEKRQAGGTEEVNTRSLDVEFAPTNRGPSIFYSRVDLGALSLGEAHEIELRLTNGMKEPVSFKTIRASCGCSTVKIPASELAPGESVLGKINFRVPNQVGAREFFIQLAFYDDPLAPPTADLEFMGHISGLLQFGSIANPLEVKGKLGSFKIPLLFSEPVTIESLEVQTSDELRDVVWKLENSEQAAYVQLIVPRAMLPANGLSGDLTVLDRKSGKKVSVFIKIVPKPPVTLSPLALRFQIKEDGSRSARVLLELADQAEEDGEPEVLRGVTLDYDGEQLELDSKQLGTSNVTRIQISIDAAMTSRLEKLIANEGEIKKLVWHVQTSRAKYQFPVLLVQFQEKAKQ